MPHHGHPAKAKSHQAASSAGVQIHGHVSLTAGPGQTLAADDLANTLVYFVSATAHARPHPDHETIYENHHQFDPRAMAVPLGSTVRFVNLDSVDHNVFSVTPGSTFNLGYQSPGENISYTFRHAGLVVINCNVHPAMEVDVMVVPTTHVARVKADGSFVLHGLPTGAGTLHVWNPRARPVSRHLKLPLTGSVQEHLVALNPAVKTELDVDASP